MGIDISDNNSLKNQKDSGKIVRKYTSRKLKTEPNEVQKYNDYLTKSKPILDEANYIAEKKKMNKTNRKIEDFEFIQDLKDKRLGKGTRIRKGLPRVDGIISLEELIGKEPSKIDMTPTVQSELELAVVDVPRAKNELFGDNIEMSQEKSAEKIEKAILDKVKRIRAKKELETQKKISDINKIAKIAYNKKDDEINKAFEEAQKQIEREQAIGLIQGAIRRREIQPLYKMGVEENKNIQATKIQSAIRGRQARQKLANIDDEINVKPQELFEVVRGEPVISKRGRPKGSKNRPK